MRKNYNSWNQGKMKKEKTSQILQEQWLKWQYYGRKCKGIHSYKWRRRKGGTLFFLQKGKCTWVWFWGSRMSCMQPLWKVVPHHLWRWLWWRPSFRKLYLYLCCLVWYLQFGKKNQNTDFKDIFYLQYFKCY